MYLKGSPISQKIRISVGIFCKNMGVKTVRKYLELIKFSHTIFALPFAFIAFLAVLNHPEMQLNREIPELGFWIIMAMVGARSGAMGFNRLIDRNWDRLNPRTQNRPSASGEISSIQMKIMIIFSFALLVFASLKLNFLSFLLSPLAIIALCFYSYTKRFTAYSHLFLGFVIGLTPTAVWISMTGAIELTPLILSMSVLCWISGFDILYSLQDKTFDRRNNLHSIPAKFGTDISCWIARGLHILTVLFWGVFSILNALGWIFNVGIMICAALLIFEHCLVDKNDLNRIDIAFFNINSIISIVLLGFYAGDLYLTV